MKFKEALKLLEQGKRIIAKKEKEAYDQLWLSLNERGSIDYMGEPWNPSPKWLIEYMEDEWINVEEDCDYHDHNKKTKECIK